MPEVDQDELSALAQRVLDQASDLAKVINELIGALKIVAARIQRNPQDGQLDRLIAQIEVFQATIKDTKTFIADLDFSTPSFRLRLQSLWRGRAVLEEFYQRQFEKLQDQSRQARARLIALQKINFDLVDSDQNG